MNGGLGRDVYGFSSVERTVNVWPVESADASSRAAGSSSTTTSSRVGRPRSSKSLPVATRRRSTATQVGGERRRPCGEGGLEVPVVGGPERDPLPLPLDHEAHREALHPAGGEALVDLAPQHRRHLVAVEAVEDAAGLLGVDEALVDLAGVVDGLLDGRPGDLVEHHPLHRHPGLQLLAAGARRWPRPRDPRRWRGRARRRPSAPPEALDHIALVRADDVLRGEAVVDVDAQALGLEVPDVARRTIRPRSPRRGSPRSCAPSPATRRSRGAWPCGTDK